MADEPGRDRFGNRAAAQEVVARHAYRKELRLGTDKGGRAFVIDWRQVNVVWINPARGQFDWKAIVLVADKPSKVYIVTYTRINDEMKVDTFTRKHVPRFY